VIGDLRITDLITKQTFFVGVYPGIDDARLEHMIETFGRFLASPGHPV
jgi:CDP-6-deoxy-D-xylo-4-hexulose-3-dehydrase